MKSPPVSQSGPAPAKPHAHEVSPLHLGGLVVGALCIAFAPIFAVLSGRVGGVGMWDAAFWRVFFGAVALAPLAWLSRGRGVPARGGKSTSGFWTWGWLWFPGVIFAGDFWAWHWSFEHTSVANSTLLANVAILFVTLFAWLVWKERITRRFVLGASVAFGGVVLLLLSSKNRVPPTEGNPVFGDLLALLTACFYASYQLSMKRCRRERSAQLLMFCASAVAAVVLLPLAWFHEDPFWPKNGLGWLPLIGLGFVSHAAGQGMIAWGLAGVPASLASVMLLVQPVCTALLGAVILGQPLVPWQIYGGAAVLAGLFVAVRAQVRRPAAVKATGP